MSKPYSCHLLHVRPNKSSLNVNLRRHSWQGKGKVQRAGRGEWVVQAKNTQASYTDVCDFTRELFATLIADQHGSSYSSAETILLFGTEYSEWFRLALL